MAVHCCNPSKCRGSSSSSAVPKIVGGHVWQSNTINRILDKVCAPASITPYSSVDDIYINIKLDFYHEIDKQILREERSRGLLWHLERSSESSSLSTGKFSSAKS